MTELSKQELIDKCELQIEAIECALRMVYDSMDAIRAKDKPVVVAPTFQMFPVCSVKYRHIRFDNTHAVTIAYVERGLNIYVGLALCNEDRFEKSEGRRIASRKLNTDGKRMVFVRKQLDSNIYDTILDGLKFGPNKTVREWINAERKYFDDLSK